MMAWSGAFALIFGLVPLCAEGQAQITFPLTASEYLPACACNSDFREGWVEAYDRCMRGAVTSCKQCPHQEKCSKIDTVVGDGRRAFTGDCDVISRAQGACNSPEKASLSYPGSIAIDDVGNLYIADFGNNRVRVVMGQEVYTLAGTGEVGFSGDGGPGPSARLRHPEGIAVRRLSTGSIQVCFSDFSNQRVRCLVQNSDGIWIISTLIGTGVRGETTFCEPFCGPLEMHLNNPRALAFTEAQDLYVVDSGNAKVKRLSADGQFFNTFLGFKPSSGGVSSFLRSQALNPLPGTWAERNEDVVIDSLYTLSVDREQNIWLADSSTSRLLKAPTMPQPEIRIAGMPGALVRSFQLHFSVSYQDKISNTMIILERLLTWLKFLEKIDEDPFVSNITRYYEGYTYWMYGQGVVQNKCQQRSSCPAIPAEEAVFQSVMGLCFDVASNIYISDTQSSELLSLEQSLGAGALESTGPRVTLESCPCLKYWVDTEEQQIGSQNSPYPKEQCADNPAYPDAQYPPGHPRAGQRLNCTVTNYCGLPYQSDVTEWCMINRSATGTGTGGEACRGGDARFCAKIGPGVTWREVPNGVLLGNEIRSLKRISFRGSEVNSDYPGLLERLPDLVTQDLWLMESFDDLRQWSILLGFRDEGEGGAPVGCGEDICCGLNSTPSLQVYRDIYPNARDCFFRNATEIDIFTTFYKQEDRPITLIWNALLSYSISESNTDEEQRSLDDCRNRCAQSWECVAWMATASSDTYCTFYTSTHPYTVYAMDRNQLAGLTAAQQRGLFRGPIKPRTRLYGNYEDLYVGTGSKDLIRGPIDTAGLLLDDCMDLCIQELECHSIAFPGCYLLNKRFFDSELEPVGTGFRQVQANQTLMFVKGQRDRKVEDVAGQHRVDSFRADDDELASRALLNRPSSCLQDSQGSLVFADTWNHRIRRISSLFPGCSFNSLLPVDDTKAYSDQLGVINSYCTNSTSMSTLMATLQRDVVERRNLDSMNSQFCNFVYTPDPTFLEGYTTNMIVLCKVCGELLPAERPALCPSQEMCDCRAKIEEAVWLTAYQNCPATNSYFDPWHRWISGYISCLADGNAEATTWWTDASKRASLLDRLRSYTR